MCYYSVLCESDLETFLAIISLNVASDPSSQPVLGLSR